MRILVITTGKEFTCVTVVDISDKGIRNEFIRLPYDVEKVASAIRESGLPPYFAEKLLEGS